MISVVIPTLTVRQHWLQRAVAAFERTLPPDHEILVYEDRPACGVAWNEGLADANGDFVLLAADDLEPHDGWWQPAVARCLNGQLPSARILNTDGSLQSCGTDHLEHDDGDGAFVARIPFATREQFDRIGPMMSEHYMGDYWFSHRGRQEGWPSIVTRDMLFTHHYAQEGRTDTLAADVREYKRRGGP